MVEVDAQEAARHAKREELRLDTLSSWKHYKATGLHVTHEEMQAWVKRLEAGEDANFPKVHT